MPLKYEMWIQTEHENIDFYSYYSHKTSTLNQYMVGILDPNYLCRSRPDWIQPVVLTCTILWHQYWTTNMLKQLNRNKTIRELYLYQNFRKIIANHDFEKGFDNRWWAFILAMNQYTISSTLRTCWNTHLFIPVSELLGCVSVMPRYKIK